MEKRDLISGTFLILLSLVVCIMAYRLGLGSARQPGAGFAAFGIACLFGLLSLGLWVKALTRIFKESRETAEVQRILWKKPLLILLVLTAYGALFHSLGFSLSTFLLMLLLVRTFGRGRLFTAFSTSVLTLVLSYVLFVMALKLPLPTGSVWLLFGG
jgi:hypothetical protein